MFRIPDADVIIELHEIRLMITYYLYEIRIGVDHVMSDPEITNLPF